MTHKIHLSLLVSEAGRDGDRGSKPNAAIHPFTQALNCSGLKVPRVFLLTRYLTWR